jgi:hypothetical protein
LVGKWFVSILRHRFKADLQAVATALSAMTGQPHPLADPTGHPHGTHNIRERPS